MANYPHARKRIRRDAKRTVVNNDRRVRIRTFVKRVEAAIAAGDKDAANQALKAAQPEIQRGVTKGILKANSASRKISRLNARIKAL